jgi:hypothetical protein
MTYLGLLYQDLLKAGQLTQQGKLSPLLPLVLYNGERPWYARGFPELIFCDELLRSWLVRSLQVPPIHGRRLRAIILIMHSTRAVPVRPASFCGSG